MMATSLPFGRKTRRILPTALPARFAALGLLALAACGSPAAAPTQAAPSATVEAAATATPTPEPTPTLVPTATEFPYDLPPLPSLEGISVEKLPECDLSVLGQSDLAYYASVVTEDDKKYLVPHPTQLNVGNFKSCDLYVVDTNSSPTYKLAMNTQAVLRVVLNEMYSEGSDYEGIVYQDIKRGSSYAGFDDLGKIATGRVWGKVEESLPWVLKSGMRGVIFVIKSSRSDPLNMEAYFFDSSYRVSEAFFEDCGECTYSLYPYFVDGESISVFHVFNEQNIGSWGTVLETPDGYVLEPRSISGWGYGKIEIHFTLENIPKPLEAPFSSK